MIMLYKYLNKHYAELLLKRGKIRLGTLYEYRDVEKHGAVIGDQGEGKKSIYLSIQDEIWTSKSQPEFGKSFFNLGEDVSLQLQGITLEKPQESPNYYLFCTTEEFNHKIMLEFGYDCCIIIERPKQFFSAITHSIRHKAKFVGVYRCQYISRRVPHNRDHGMHPAIIKDPCYRNQKEVRAMWRPIKNNIQSIIIECHDAAKYCRIHKGL
jgi:hypothetical protein